MSRRSQRFSVFAIATTICALAFADGDEAHEDRLSRVLSMTHLSERAHLANEETLAVLSSQDYRVPRLDAKRDRILAEIRREYTAEGYCNRMASQLASSITEEEVGQLLELLSHPAMRRLREVLLSQEGTLAQVDDDWRSEIMREYFQRFAEMK